MPQRDVEIIFGAGFMAALPEPEQIKFLDILEEKGVTHMDTAYAYIGSERTLGKHSASTRFTIDTKAPGFRPGAMNHDAVLAAGKKSLERLKTDRVNVYFLHSPDTATPIEETLEAVQRLWEGGMFKYFGLSNFLPASILSIHAHQSSKNYVLPTVYQGLYNPVSRRAEDDIFPTLRRLNMSFYAYSPLAAGLLVRNPSQLDEGIGRWDSNTPLGKILHGNYNNEEMREALVKWDGISRKYGVGKGEMAYRWVRYHSMLKGEYGDAVVFGASTVKQLEETAEWLNRGRLEEGCVREIEGVWDGVKGVAVVNNFYGRKEGKGSKI